MCTAGMALALHSPWPRPLGGLTSTGAIFLVKCWPWGTLPWPCCVWAQCLRMKVKKKAWLLAFSEPRGPGAQLQSPTQPRLPAPCWLRSPFSSSGPTSQGSGRAKRPGRHAPSPCVFLILSFVWGTEAQKALEPSQPRGGCSEDGQPELWLMGKQNPRGCSL